MKYRKAIYEDSRIMAELHAAAFKGFFLTSLGPGFLKAYYGACIKDSESVVICAINDYNCIIGFASGSLNSHGYHKKIFMKNIAVFFKELLFFFFTNPVSILRLIKNLNKDGNKVQRLNCAELLSIAVSPQFFGRGIGSELLQLFENEIKLAGKDEIILTTDYRDNSNVLLFYQRNGYEIESDFFTYPNRHMYRLKKNI